MSNLNKIIRYIVEHDHQAYSSAPVERAWAQYNTALDSIGSTPALVMAHHTAARYHGVIFAETAEGKEVIKSYARKTQTNT